MAKAVALYTGGIQELREVAVRHDGAVFSRMQDRHPRYGYRWSGWNFTGRSVDVDALPAEMSCGFADLSRATPNSARITVQGRFKADGSLRVRLPND